MGQIIFQLLPCLYLYDSGIQVPVRIRKQSWYTDFWRLALTYRAAGIPTSDATGKFAQSWYTDFWRHRETCAKPVYRLPTSYGLNRLFSLVLMFAGLRIEAPLLFTVQSKCMSNQKGPY